MSSLKKHILAIILAFTAFLFFYYIWVCPFKLLFKTPCMGCGMTRSLMYALRLDFKNAFHFHPLWFTVPPVVIYLYFKKTIKLNSFELAASIILVAAFIFVWFYRLMFCNIINFL